MVNKVFDLYGQALPDSSGVLRFTLQTLLRLCMIGRSKLGGRPNSVTGLQEGGESKNVFTIFLFFKTIFSTRY